MKAFSARLFISAILHSALLPLAFGSSELVKKSLGEMSEGREQCSRPQELGGLTPPPFLRGGALLHPEGFPHKLSAQAADPTVWTVNTTSTTQDGTCDATHCSLPEAIKAANLNDGPDIVAFNIPASDPGCDVTGVCTISPQDTLEELFEGETTIDGFTQPGASPNSNPFGQPINAVLKIVLDGSHIPYCCSPGIWVTSAGNRVRGLVIHGFYEGISLQHADDNHIEGNFIGTDALGNSAMGSRCSGIIISTYEGAPGSSGNVVGGTTPEARNLISGNGCSGVEIGPSGSNLVQGNYIGTDAAGLIGIANGFGGVRVFNISQGNQIGGAVAGAANLIAFNDQSGVIIDGGLGAVHNTISRNRIHSNGEKGIALLSGGNNNLAAPVITSAGPTQVAGTACNNCVVEIFSDTADEGAVYEGTTAADGSGNWLFTTVAALTGPQVTATATDANGSTSEFSAPASLQPPTRTPSWTPTATAIPSATPTRTPTSTATATTAPSATPTRTATATPNPSPVPTRTATATVTHTTMASPTSSATASATAPPTLPLSRTATRTTTRTPTSTVSPTRTASRTATATATLPAQRTPTVTASPAASSTPPTPPSCTGNCNDDHRVAINELLLGIDIALGRLHARTCPAFDRDSNGRVTVDELVAAVNNALHGCSDETEKTSTQRR